jgi:16S rRNA (cytosine967-C5)-methyltransferase
VEEARLAALASRAARAGVKVRTTLISPDIMSQLQHRADRVLVDAPCTGSGTLRRQADLKYRITADGLRQKQEIQRELLAQFAELVRPGGKLVYATCSILPGENEKQAGWFSAQRPDFTMEEERRISPALTGWDGFYMARWTRKSHSEG